jgi:hypothetical protein
MINYFLIILLFLQAKTMDQHKKDVLLSIIEIDDKKQSLKNVLMIIKKENESKLKIDYYNNQEICEGKLNCFCKLVININKKNFEASKENIIEKDYNINKKNFSI